MKNSLFFIRDFVQDYKNFLIEQEGISRKYNVNIKEIQKQLPIMMGEINLQTVAKADPTIFMTLAKTLAFFVENQAVLDDTSELSLRERIILLDKLTSDLETAIGPSKLILTPTNLDPKLIERCAGKDYHDTITNAFPILEDKIKEKLSTIPGDNKLLDEAFNPNTGKLKIGTDAGQQEGIYFLFRGAFAFLRNPPSHSMKYEKDDSNALKVMYFVDLLLKIVDEAELKPYFKS